ncbi:MAG: hypothetical protein CMM95_02030 [Rickettsiales bacterium]|nr:hypothetical protein [Rickettsiales bacterium]
MKKYKLLYFVSEDEYFLTHKVDQAKSALKLFDIMVVTNFNKYEERIKKLGFQTSNLNFDRKSLNPISNFLVFINFLTIIFKFKPNIIQAIALKPIFYNTIASFFFKNNVKTINCVVGLGYLFINKKIKTVLIKKLYFLILNLFLKKNTYFVFQNNDDLTSLKKLGVLKNSPSRIIRGSGVDIQKFTNSKKKKEYDLIFHSRILKDKGVYELIDALKILRNKKIFLNVLMLGSPDPKNMSSVPIKNLKEWEKQKLIIWKKKINNVIPFLQASKISILPSYREGLPKCLLEAASCGLPIITSNVPGCREICINQYNGILVKAKDSESLSWAIKELIGNSQKIKKYGKNGRILVKKNFLSNKISNDFIQLYKELLK